MLIGYDFDSVIIDNYNAMRLWFLEEYDHDLGPKHEHHNFALDMPPGCENEYHLIQRALFEMHETMPPMDCSTHWMHKIHTGPCKYQLPIIITCRDQRLLGKITKWMGKWYRWPFELYITKSHAEKTERARELGLTHYVEDRYANAIRFAEASFIEHVFLVNQYWNLGREVPDNVTRVNDLGDVYKILCSR